MKTLFFRTLLASIAGFLLLLVVLAAFIYFGFERSLDSWSQNKLTEVQSGIEKILIDRENIGSVSFPDNISVFIYGTDQKMIFSNRGEGRERSFTGNGDVNQVTIDGVLLGYYHIGNIAFQNDYSNQQFISSIIQVGWIGAAFSCVLSVVYALLFSKSLARPATAVAKGIRGIAGGSLEHDIPESGTEEIAAIAHAANDLRKQLKREQLLRVQWAQDIAHDLRTPISALKAQFEGILDGVLPLNTDRIEKNVGEIHRVEKLINDLQELMQLETPDLSPDITDFRLDEALANVAGAFSYEAERKNATITVKSPELHIRGDSDLFHRAFSNIVSNATRHVDEGGSIELTAEDTDGDVVLRFRNTGDGIPKDELGRVFDRLFRGDHARHSLGSGLGLTIARQIVELHGGTISIESAESEWTTVTIRLSR